VGQNEPGCSLHAPGIVMSFLALTFYMFIYLQINLKHGISRDVSANYRDTCTACAGTMILEFAALSRLTGDPVYEVSNLFDNIKLISRLGCAGYC
jgi:hypothetical protein